MRSSFLLFIVFVGFVALFTAQSSAKLNQTFLSGPLQVNQTTAYTVIKQTPVRPQGVANLTLSSAYTVEVCLQEDVELLGDLSSCNPGGYFLFERSSNVSGQADFFSLDEDSVSTLFGGEAFESNFVGDAWETTTVNMTLRGESQYFLSVRYVGANLTNASATYYISFSYQTDGCNSTEVGTPNGCMDSTPASLDSPMTGQNILGNTVGYYEIGLAPNINQFLQATLTLTNTGSPLPADTNPQITLALRREAAPAYGQADASSISTGNSNGQYSVYLPVPVPNTTYYLAITNPGIGILTFDLLVEAQGCTNGGGGPNCTGNLTDLTGNYNVTMFTGIGDYQYFHMQNLTLTVGVGTKDLEQAAPTLLASLWNYPSNNTALLVSSNNTVNYISVRNPNPEASDTWFVSVWAYEGQEYYIWANNYCPYDCFGSKGGNSSRGVCNPTTGMCDCSKGNDGLFCDSKGLALVWIIVIIIVCVIILAIAIGVPVACFLRNRRRARYERV